MRNPTRWASKDITAWFASTLPETRQTDRGPLLAGAGRTFLCAPQIK